MQLVDGDSARVVVTIVVVPGPIVQQVFLAFILFFVLPTIVFR